MVTRYYFDDPAAQARLKKVLDSWLGTPYRHRTMVKQLGCDCIHGVAGVVAEIGLIDPARLDVPDYPRDWHLHNTRELLLEHITQQADVDVFDWPCSLLDGDILLSYYGKAASHAGIYFDGYVYQAIDKAGFIKVKLKRPAQEKRIRFVVRVKA